LGFVQSPFAIRASVVVFADSLFFVSFCFGQWQWVHRTFLFEGSRLCNCITHITTVATNLEYEKCANRVEMRGRHSGRERCEVSTRRSRIHG